MKSSKHYSYQNSFFSGKKQKSPIVLRYIGVLVIAVLVILVALFFAKKKEEPSAPSGSEQENPSLNESDETNPRSSFESDESDESESEEPDESETPLQIENPTPTPTLPISDRARGYGGYRFPVDSNNRSQYILNEQAIANQNNLDVHFFCADPSEKKIMLTFQAGMEVSDYTSRVLNILSEKNVKAEFFVAYGYARDNPNLIRKIIQDGHILGSHGYMTSTESGIAALGHSVVVEDAVKMQNYIRDNFGYTMNRYNFNSGTWSPYASYRLNTELGQKVILACVSYDDYNQTKEFNVSETLAQLKQDVCPGAIFAFHMVNPITFEMLPDFIDYCLSNGYEFITI